ncbi:MAG: helix-turn-helix domain-containing protein, partial [Limisphaerales bacterium]
MIEPDKRKAIFLLHQEGMPLRELSRRLALSRNTVRRVIAQEGRVRARSFTPAIDPDLLRQLYQECNGYVQRVWEKLQEERGLAVKYSTLTRWLRQLGISLPASSRCDRVPDEPGAEMQHDTSPFTVALGQTSTKLQASLLYLRYSKRRYLQFYRVFDRFQMKCFLHQALLHWGYAPGVCIIDNTNLARLRGLGEQAVIVPEMEAFGKTYGFRFFCHAPKHPDRKAGEERSFLTTETNFLPGRTFQSMEDLNRQALDWSTVRMEQRPQGKAGLIPAQAFEHERGFLQQLPPHLPAPYKLLERSVDEYGYVAVEANYYWVPGSERGEVKVLRYDQHIEIYQFGQQVVQYPLLPQGVKNQPVHPPGQPVSRYKPRHRKQPSDQEEKRLRDMAPAISAYVDFILATPGLLRHQYLRRLLVLSQRMSPELFVRSVERAHRYRITSLATLEKIALLQFKAGVDELPVPPIDESFRDRPAYQEGSLTDSPD